MQRTDFEYILRNKVQVISGAIGSEIERREKEPMPFTPRFILERPDLIRSIHADFAKAGATILVTGTARANREILLKKSLSERLEDINRSAVGLAKESLPPEGRVFGTLGSTGALLKPYGKYSEWDYQTIFKEQAEILMDAGVDGFLVEGFSSLIEAEQCVLALKALCSLPIIATMTILEDGCTKFGDSLEDCCKALQDAGADVVGIHGTLGPLEIDGFVASLEGNYPLCVRPNAGYPVRIGNVQTYLSSPDYVAEFAESFWKRGAIIVGGASGFSPDHIAEVAKRLAGRSPHQPEEKHSATAVAATVETTAEASEAGDGKSLADKFGKEPVISVEIEPPQGLSVQNIIELLKELKPYGVDAVNIPENPLARARISSIALARLIKDQVGLDSIAHLTCRDRNLISLQAELLGSHMLGVHNILALTGDPTGVGDFPSATSNFDVDSTGLVEIMARMNIGKDFGMNDLGSATRFNIGVAANPLADNLDMEMARLEVKLKRGATFIQTQPIFDPNRLDAFMKRVEPFRVPVLFGVMLIRDYRNAKFLINEYPGIHIRESHLERFRTTADEEQEALGVAIACELISELNPIGAGVYLMTSFGEERRLLDVFKKLRS